MGSLSRICVCESLAGEVCEVPAADGQLRWCGEVPGAGGEMETVYCFMDPQEPLRKYIDQFGSFEERSGLKLDADRQCWPSQAAQIFTKLQNDRTSATSSDDWKVDRLPSFNDWLKLARGTGDDEPDGVGGGGGSAGRYAAPGEGDPAEPAAGAASTLPAICPIEAGSIYYWFMFVRVNRLLARVRCL